MKRPADHVLAALGLFSSSLRPLPGGRGTTWHAGESILKLVSLTEQELRWQVEALGTLKRVPFRISPPRSSLNGSYLIDGWAAWTYLPGRHEPRRWPDILQAGDELQRALAPLARPPFLDARRDPWALADRAAWMDVPPQVIHGDLTGNVLFLDGDTPAVIDLSLYWRPMAYAAAIVVADALVWEGADERLLTATRMLPDFAPCFLRALLFRLVTDELLTNGTADTRAYERAVNLACLLNSW